MTAQKLSHKKDTNEKSRFEFGDASSNTASTTASKPKKEPITPTKSTKSSQSPPSKPAPSAPKKATTAKKVVVTKPDEDDVVLIKEAKKTVAKPKETNKAKPGQKGLLGIAKIVNWF